MVHGSDDPDVALADARALADAATGPSELHVVCGAGHWLRADPRVIAILVGWLERPALNGRSTLGQPARRGGRHDNGTANDPSMRPHGCVARSRSPARGRADGSGVSGSGWTRVRPRRARRHPGWVAVAWQPYDREAGRRAEPGCRWPRAFRAPPARYSTLDQCLPESPAACRGRRRGSGSAPPRSGGLRRGQGGDRLGSHAAGHEDGNTGACAGQTDVVEPGPGRPGLVGVASTGPAEM